MLTLSEVEQALIKTACEVGVKALLSKSNTHDPPRCFTAHALTTWEEPIDMIVPLLKYLPNNAKPLPMAVRELSSCMQGALVLSATLSDVINKEDTDTGN